MTTHQSNMFLFQESLFSTSSDSTFVAQNNINYFSTTQANIMMNKKVGLNISTKKRSARKTKIVQKEDMDATFVTEDTPSPEDQNQNVRPYISTLFKVEEERVSEEVAMHARMEIGARLKVSLEFSKVVCLEEASIRAIKWYHEKAHKSCQDSFHEKSGLLFEISKSKIVVEMLPKTLRDRTHPCRSAAIHV